MQPYVPDGLTIILFATDYDVHENATVHDVADVLSRHDFQFGTCLFEPLADRLQAYLNHHKPGDKPLLVGVITDGLPWPRPEPQLVRQVLVAASRHFAPGQVTVVFFQIGGDDEHGRDYLMDLGSNLTGYGASYQLAHTVSFEQLQQLGLAKALVAAAGGNANAAPKAGRMF